MGVFLAFPCDRVMLRVGSQLPKGLTSLHAGRAITARAYTNESNNQEEPKWRQRRNQKKAFYQRKGFWFFTATATAATGFAIYELNPNGTFGPKTLSTLQKLPLRWMSHLWGKFTSIQFPASVNMKLLKAYSWVYGCNLDEMKEPLDSYMSIQDFFVRRLKDDVRPFVKEGVASPVDGTIMSFQEIARDSDELEQIKGIEYSLSGFLGESVERKTHLDDSDNRLYHCIIYLAPGDYHGIHSPVDWSVKRRRYFPGYLFPVAPVVVRKMQNLLGMNERVILSGEWEHGYFSLSPVGATNVGSISLFPEPEFKSNLPHHKPNKNLSFEENYLSMFDAEKGFSSGRGDEIAFFHMGSTVVLIFESPALEFDVLPGDHVKMGTSLAHFVKPNPSESEKKE